MTRSHQWACVAVQRVGTTPDGTLHDAFHHEEGPQMSRLTKGISARKSSPAASWLHFVMASYVVIVGIGIPVATNFFPQSPVGRAFLHLPRPMGGVVYFLALSVPQSYSRNSSNTCEEGEHGRGRPHRASALARALVAP